MYHWRIQGLELRVLPDRDIGRYLWTDTLDLGYGDLQIWTKGTGALGL